eukprot:COSAG04_NODE_4694_length_1945_cov_0.942579_5_plen_21_part_01
MVRSSSAYKSMLARMTRDAQS